MVSINQLFLKQKKGVVVFDAPADYGKKLPEIIKQNIPDKEIRYLIYSHGHKDHIGASGVFKSIEGLQIIAQEAVYNSIKRRKNPDILQPNIVFENEYILSLGQEEIELKNQGNFHSTDADIFIYLPKQKALIAIDILSPGYAPFKNFEITLDFHRYLTVYDTILAYDFELILTGHLGIWGVRKDVLDSREYVHDVEATAKYVLEKTASGDLFGKVDTELKGNSHSDLAYRYYLEVMAEECADQVINKWKNRLAGVDVWADGHCETALIYLLLH
jgi:glyoxylase-like metal-dependent hydrolase (beta-lactamase superfamily II)